MATFEVGQQAYPTKDQIRDQILNDQLFAAEAEGITLNILPGSDHYIRADAFAGPVSIAIANGKLARAAISPLTAQGDDLLALAAVHGVTARPATSAVGSVIIKCTPVSAGDPATIVTIPAAYKLTSADGFRYQTTTAFTGGGGGEVEIEALLTGEDTNQDAGSGMNWDSSAVGGLLPGCTVATGGITGGADADTVEVVRRRLLDKLAAPGVGGNANHCNQLAEGASAAIAKAYTYSGIRGPGSVDVAILKDSGDRTLNAATIALANGALVSELPGNWSIVVTTVTPEEVDIVFDTSLPKPQNAGGAGGGWIDADPWPAEITKITNITADVATVNSTATPTIGDSIGVWDPDVEDEDGDDGVMREYKITAVSGPPGAYLIEVEGGFLGDHTIGNTVDPLVSAGAHSLTLYAKAARDQFAALGPGEKTASTLLLPRSRRHPPPDVSGPMAINSRVITGIESSFPEIALTYAARYETGTTTPITSPSLPATTADPPNIIKLEFLSFIYNA